MFIFIFDEYSTEMSCSYSTNIREYEYEYEYVEYSPIPGRDQFKFKMILNTSSVCIIYPELAARGTKLALVLQPRAETKLSPSPQQLRDGSQTRLKD